MPCLRWSFLSLLAGLSVGVGTCPRDTAAAERPTGINPHSPDTIELTRKIRDHIVETSGGDTEADFNAYEGWMTKMAVPRRFPMVPIPAGEFLMGSPATEAKRHPDEGPQVKVKLDACWMGATEVTWDLYKPFMDTAVMRWKDGSKK